MAFPLLPLPAPPTPGSMPPRPPVARDLGRVEEELARFLQAPPIRSPSKNPRLGRKVEVDPCQVMRRRSRRGVEERFEVAAAAWLGGLSPYERVRERNILEIRAKLEELQLMEAREAVLGDLEAPARRQGGGERAWTMVGPTRWSSREVRAPFGGGQECGGGEELPRRRGRPKGSKRKGRGVEVVRRTGRKREQRELQKREEVWEEWEQWGAGKEEVEVEEVARRRGQRSGAAGRRPRRRFPRSGVRRAGRPAAAELECARCGLRCRRIYHLRRHERIVHDKVGGLGIVALYCE